MSWSHLREAGLGYKHGTSAMRPTRLLLQNWSMLNFATLSRPSGAMAPRPPRMASISVQVAAVKRQVRSTPTTVVILECSFIRMFPTSTRRFTLR